MSASGVNLERYLIPLEEIKRATENFSQQRCIGHGGFGAVYRGQLSERWQNRTVAIKRLGRDSKQGNPEFRNELKMISRCQHENIISFIGYCDEDKEMIIVYDYAINGSLDHHLQDPNKMCCITWTQRLKICLGAARGLNYLHSGLEEHNRVIHRDFKSANILLHKNLVAKICDFGLSKLAPKNQPNSEVFTKVAGTRFYMDPIYHESSILRKESDVYSFGVVLFEILSGRLVYSERTTEDDRSEMLMTSVRRHSGKALVKLLDPDIRLQIHTPSFDMFKEIAYQCISFNVIDRPRMETIVKTLEEALKLQTRVNLERYLIPLEEINRATGKFKKERCIGGGRFGVVYKGQLSERWQKRTVAVKRLHRDSYQGDHEFHNELEMISLCHHENIIHFIGYCDQDKEMIIVYDYAINGSLYHHLQYPNKMRCITWKQRLKICIGAARGLYYLHSGLEHNKVIHGDVKSANILLHENLVAKICDFGLSKLGPQNQPNIELFTKLAGTRFYMDPIYYESCILQRQSDVYSFGVVLFEILSGRLAYSERITEDISSKILMNIVRRHRRNALVMLLDPDIRLQIHTHSFDMFTQIAYQCISFNAMDRPRMETIVETLEEALRIQAFHEGDHALAWLKVKDLSKDEDGGVEIQESGRLRDRGVATGSNRDDGDDTSEESVNDEDEHDDEDAGNGGGMRMLPPPPEMIIGFYNQLFSNKNNYQF